mgnify:FL=1
MKLLRISIHGFKSFADKVTIDIKDGITAIVGPNGSGKSNIVDAIKWVLGQQSLKDIRGNNSSDFIFNGSKSRSPLTRAWVSLTFDNSDHYLKSDLAEIEIKRVVYSTGENEYYINNSTCRLKDITNLFLDSGTNVNSLSIISQGKIGEIIDGKPEDKRVILEEAAGVLMYKKRKEDALRKLDKTNDNIEKINLIIDELSVNLEPLKEQAATAHKYLDYKKDLESTEIALLAIDITDINDSYKKHKEELDKLSNDLMVNENNNLVDGAKIDSLKIQVLKLEEEISKKSDELFKITKQLSNLASEKQIMIEREKYEVDDAKLQANIINLKETKLKITNDLESLKEEIELKKNNLSLLDKKYNELVTEYKNENIKKNLLLSDLGKLNKDEMYLKSQIEILENSTLNDSKLPYAVKSILNNHRLKGIHDILGKLIDTEEKYSLAIDTSLGFTANVIVTDNEVSAKEAVYFLRQNNLGRATFYPLNVIKAKRVDDISLKKLEVVPCFIGIASDLCKFDPKYRNVVLNALGNVIVVDNLTNATNVAKIINHMYKIVTLDGDIINAGGSITGGTNKSVTSMMSQKFELENKIKLLNSKVNEIKLKEEEINAHDKDVTILERKVFDANNELNSAKDYLLRKNNELESLNNNLISVNNEINGSVGLLNNDISSKLQEILDEYYKVNGEKEKLEISINELKLNKNDLQSEVNELELASRKQNSEYNKMMNDVRTLEVTISKEENKLDNYLVRLSEEYGMTYDKAKEYNLDMNITDARIKVNNLKRDIKALGEVNTGSISEFDRINTRYEFLTKQKDDLTGSINDLLEIINELDGTMKDRLTNTFNALNNEFCKVFKKLFRGGEGKLVLLDENNILTSGLEIKACPPGKEIKSLKTLSGGEASMTALALLFATLNIRTVPFCILDEAEAALDEANVDIFGNYLKEYNNKTQFIVITHKKRTMEYASCLYGITMQESGVSKLVSVKLD